MVKIIDTPNPTSHAAGGKAVSTDKRTPNGKKVQLQLKYELGGYKVISITNTTVVHPGQMLDTKWVQMVCDEYDNWEVTMVDNDMMAQIFGFVRGLIPLPI